MGRRPGEVKKETFNTRIKSSILTGFKMLALVDILIKYQREDLIPDDDTNRRLF